MYGGTRTKHRARPAIVVTAATLLALALPVSAPLYADVYPGPDADSVEDALGDANLGIEVQSPEDDETELEQSDVNDALTDAELDASSDSPKMTQFETASFRATIIYGTSINPDLPTVKVAWSNEAVLADAADIFTINPTSESRRYLDSGTLRPDGGYELTWTWDVTPLIAGEQTLTLSILPTVVVEGEQIPELANINKPIPVTVDVHPVKQDFDEVLTAAGAMVMEVPDEMIVGDEHEVSASMSMMGNADTVSADIELAQGEGSTAVTIVEASAGPRAGAQLASIESDPGSVIRRWTVIPDEPGQVALVFTARVEGQAGAHGLQQDVPKQASARAKAPPPSFWDILQQPVLYLAPFVALGIGVLGLWAAWKKRKGGEEDSDSQHASESSSDPVS